MKLFGRDLSREVCFVAEIGVNHEGDPGAAERLLGLALDAGADAVKFQTYTPERFVSAADAERLERVRRFDLGEACFRRLSSIAKARGGVFFSSAITEDVVPLLAEIGPAIKIASGDITFRPVIAAAAATGLPVILSTGCATTEEVDTAVGWVTEVVGDHRLNERLVLLHCVSAYPTPIEQANLASIRFLAERYGVPVGWSSHVPGVDVNLAAIALGARVVEAHFTDAREGREFRDHHLALLPDEFAALVTRGRAVATSIGRPGKTLQPAEASFRPVIRKGIIAARDLPAGAVLAEADVMYARTDGLPATSLRTTLGRKLRVPVAARHPLRAEHLAEAL